MIPAESWPGLAVGYLAIGCLTLFLIKRANPDEPLELWESFGYIAFWFGLFLVALVIGAGYGVVITAKFLVRWRRSA